MLSLLRPKRRAPAECLVFLRDQELIDLYPTLVEVVVETDRSEATEARLVLETRRFEDGRWAVHDDDRFLPWTSVRIEAAFGGDREEVMRGYIREIKLEFPEEKGSARVTVVCQDESLKLDRLHVNQSWGADAPTTDATIASEIASRNDLTLLAPPGTGQSNLEANQNATDIRFLKERAEANGYELFFREGGLYFGPMRLEAEAQDPILVYAGTSTNCTRFNVDDDGHQPDAVAFEVAAATGSQSSLREVRPDLPLLGREPADSRHAGLGDFVWRPSRQGVSDESQMEAQAQRMANEQSMKIKASGELDGSSYGHVLRVGEPVLVDGVGDRYGGTYYVDTATHHFDVRGFRTEFRLLRNAYGDSAGTTSSVLAAVL